MDKNYIGYATLEKLATESLAKSRSKGSLNMMGVAETARANHGLVNIETAIIASFIDDGGDIHYCRVLTSKFLSQDGHTPVFQDKPYQAWAKQAHDTVENWLTDTGFVVVEALVAMPKNYKYLNGCADFLRFDRNIGFYSDTLYPQREERVLVNE